MNTYISIRRVASAIGLMLVLAGCNPTYQEPAESTAEASFPIKTSALTIPVTASLDDLQARLEASIPNPLATIDENRDACVPGQWFTSSWLGIKTRISPDIDCHLSGAATRGAIALGGSGNAITLQMPVAVQVTARGRGDIGSHIRETASGAADVTATAAVDIDESWTPTAQLSADHTWTDRLGVTILGIRITFASKADEAIADALSKFQASLPSRLAELDVRTQAEAAWAEAFTVARVHEEPNVWIRFTPTDIGFSGLNIVDRTATAALLAVGQTEVFVGTQPEPSPVTPLPPLRRDLPPTGFEIALPITVDYSAINSAASTALKLGQRQEIQVDGIGPVGVTVNNLVVRSADGGSLGIGLDVTADPPSSLFDTHAVVWLTGKPTIDNEAKRVRVTDLAIYGVADNQIADVLVEVSQILLNSGVLSEALSYDFSADYAEGLAKANELLVADLGEGISVTASIADATVDAIVPDESALYLVLSARGEAQVNVGAAQ